MAKYEGVKTKFLTPVGRLVFEQLFKAKGYEGAKPKFSATVILQKGDPEVEAWIADLKANIMLLKKAKWPDDGVKPDVVVLKNGDTSTYVKGKNKGKLRKEVNPEVAGHWIITASRPEDSQYPHAVVDRNLDAITNPKLVYSGCWGRLEFSIFPYDKGDLGIAGGLELFQKAKDDKPLARTAASLAEKMEPLAGAPNALPTADDDEGLFNE